MSVRMKITLWFSVALTLVALVTVSTLIFAEQALLRQTVKSQLIQTVETNCYELEFFPTYEDMANSFDSDRFIPHGDGFVGIDTDFLAKVNGVYVAIYSGEGELLYGENPFGRELNSTEFTNAVVRKAGSGSGACFVFDAEVSFENAESLWLRGTALVDARAGELNHLVRLSAIILPALIFIALLGGYLIARKHLKPAEAMTKTISEISSGNDLKRRIETGKSNDEVQRLANSFNLMMDRLEASFEKEKQFTSDVSHELRTPVAVISAQCDYILEEERSREEYIEALEAVKRQNSVMSRMISDMLDFTRLERNTEVYKKEEVDLSTLVSLSCADIKAVSEKGITVHTVIEENISLNGNSDLLIRMISNLISNAYKYGKEKGNINVSLYRNEGNIFLEIKDDGIGISEEDIPRVFDRFFRADPSRSSKGTGLGLPIAREIARFHGGDITLQSEEGKGSIFTVILPEK